MQKIVTLFARNFGTSTNDRKVRDEVTPGAEWVVQGQGTATRKWDGMAVMVKGGRAFRRYDAKGGRKAPADFVPSIPVPDPVTRHWPGWVPVTPLDRPVNLSLAWATENLFGGGPIPDGTYEAIGPLVGTRGGPNPEGLPEQRLVRHGVDHLPDAPRDYDGLALYLRGRAIEGVVWHHPDGRMVKVKARDFPG